MAENLHPGAGQGPSARSLLGVVSTGSFLAACTSSVINIALPDIAKDFRVNPSAAAWYVLGFLLAVTVLLLVAGRLADQWGHSRVYVVGSGVFAVAAAWCALAGSSGSFIAARVLQGASSSMVMATAPALMTLGIGPKRRGFALGMMSTATYLGLTIGPPLGGWAMDAWGWRSIFWVSCFASLLVAVIAARVLPSPPPSRKPVRFDFAGAALTAVGTLSFLIALTQWSKWGLRHPVVIAAAVLSCAALPAFVWVELRHPNPTVDVRLFRIPMFSSATLSALLNYASLFVASYCLPFAFRDGQGMSPSQAGRVMASLALAMALLAWASGTLSDRIGSRGLATVGMVVLAAGMAGLALAWPTSGMWQPAMWLALCGAGIGVFVSPNSSALMGAAPRDRQGTAGGVMGLARNLGMTLGVAMGSALFARVFPGDASHQWSIEADGALRIGLWISAIVALLAALVAFFGRPSVGQQNVGSSR